jgi:hypothetical protein
MLTDSVIRKSQPKDSDSKLFDGGGVLRLAGPFGLLPSPGTANQRRDFDSPHGISVAYSLASVATSLWQFTRESSSTDHITPGDQACQRQALWVRQHRAAQRRPSLFCHSIKQSQFIT